MSDTTESKINLLKTNYSILIAICLAHLSNDLIQAIIPVSLPMLKDNYDLNFTQIGMITLFFQLSSSIFQPIVGAYTDKNPMPYSQIIGMVFSLIGVVLLAYVRYYHGILIAVTFIGIGSSIFHPESSRVAYLSSGGKRSLAQSIFQIGGNTGTAIAPLIIGWIVLPYGQKNIIYFIAIIFFAQLVLAYIAKWYALVLSAKSNMKKKTILLPDLSHSKVRNSIIILLILIFSKYFYIASISSYLQFYLIEKFHINDLQSHIYLFYFLIAVAVGTLLGGFLGDKVGRKYIIWFSVLGCAPFTLILPYVNLFWSGVLVSIIGLILSSAFPSILVYAQELLPKKIGMISGLFYGFAFGMGGLGAALLGWWADVASLEFIYKVCSFLPLLGMTAYFLPDMKKIRFKEVSL
ncbi:MAG: MFS transporter [Chitinophagales bacterium]|nr:MFS transporter [Chitinophagales bacterium]